MKDENEGKPTPLPLVLEFFLAPTSAGVLRPAAGRRDRRGSSITYPDTLTVASKVSHTLPFLSNH